MCGDETQRHRDNDSHLLTFFVVGVVGGDGVVVGVGVVGGGGSRGGRGLCGVCLCLCMYVCVFWSVYV